MDFRNLTPLHRARTIIDEASVFIGSDSALLHVAGATKTPMIGLFTSVKAQYRMPLRENAIGLDTKLECGGCLADYDFPVTSLSCRFGTDACTRSFDPVEVAKLALEMARA